MLEYAYRYDVLLGRPCADLYLQSIAIRLAVGMYTRISQKHLSKLRNINFMWPSVLSDDKKMRF